MKLLMEKFLIRLFYGPNNRYQSLPITNTGAAVRSDLIQLISMQKLSVVTLFLPMFSFIFCIIWTIIYNFTDSTSTHCGVSNYLPSVSASTGSYSPQKYFWRSSIALHSTPRYLISYIYYRSLHNSKKLLMINWIEISSLFGLSMISSTEVFLFHAYCFLMFIWTSFFGMLIHLLHEELWSRLKMKIFCINTLSWILALFLYFRHNNYCESGVYSLFSASEYLLVLTNMIFHFQAYYDFKPMYLSCGKIQEMGSKLSV